MSDLSPQRWAKADIGQVSFTNRDFMQCRPYSPLHTVRTWSQKADCRPHKASFQDLGLRDLCRRAGQKFFTL